MKRALLLSILLGLFALSIVSCDVIEDPIKDNGNTADCVKTRTDTVNPQTSFPDTVYRNVLVEDFTGHRCKNCPKATKALKDMKDAMGEDLVVLAIHSGASTFTAPNPPDYPTDFTTVEGDDIADWFGGVPAQPIGMVNRDNYSAGSISHFKIYSQWNGIASGYLTETAVAELWSMSYVSGTCITAHCQATFLEDVSNNYSIAVYLKEDGIIAPQLLPDDTRDPDYVHNNVLRDAFTFALGEPLTTSPVTSMTNVHRSYQLEINPDWNTSNLKVVTVLFDTDTREVVQVTQCDVE